VKKTILFALLLPLAMRAQIALYTVNNGVETPIGPVLDLGKVAAGDTVGALDASKKAKLFSFIAIGLGLLGIVGYVLFVVIMGVGMGLAGSSSSF